MAKKKDKNRKRISLDFWNGTADVTNAFKTLFANIRFAAVDGEIKTIVIVGCGVSEGKTMTSLNLANAIASSGNKVLIVEGDMRKSSIGDLLGVKPDYGIFSILSGACTPKDACVETKINNLYFLDSEHNIPSPPDLLSTERFAALVDNLHDNFDYVIFDTPPLGSFVDGAIIANLVDATIVVVRQGKARRADVNEIIKQLHTANANILGTVLTFSTEASEKDYYYAYYNKDHERVNKEDFKPKEEIPEEVAKSNLDSWLNEKTTGQASERRTAMAMKRPTSDDVKPEKTSKSNHSKEETSNTSSNNETDPFEENDFWGSGDDEEDKLFDKINNYDDDEYIISKHGKHTH